MSRLLKTIGAAAIVVSLAAAPGFAQQPTATDTATDSDKQRFEESLRKGIERVLRALEALAGSVPLYEMPEIQKNGDILIRRKNPRPAPKPAKPDRDDDASST